MVTQGVQQTGALYNSFAQHFILFSFGFHVPDFEKIACELCVLINLVLN